MSEPMISRETFERDYAERSNTTVEWLRRHGREAAPCDCDSDRCQGWQMIYTRAERTTAKGIHDAG
jgi:hypothetical protein